jgi:membrane protease YdiL (CAAX protease family)
VRLFDLVSFDRQRLGPDLLLGLAFVVPFLILAMAGGMVFAPLIYGTTQAPAPYGALPLWGVLYSFLIWPIIWGIAEETTYQGYALPRLEVLSGHAWLAVAVVSFGWAIQHSALPFIPNWKWVLYRATSSLPLAIVLPIVYLRIRRLLPFVIAHWIANLVLLLFVVLPSLAG